MTVATAWSYSFGIDELTPTKHCLVPVLVEAHSRLHLFERGNWKVLAWLSESVGIILL